MPIISTVLTGAIAAAIANFYQTKQFKFQESETRKSEFRQQKETFVIEFIEKLSTTVFELVSVTEVITDSSLTTAEIVTRFSDYESSLKETAADYSSDLAYLLKYYNQDLSDFYKNNIIEGEGHLDDLNGQWKTIYQEYKCTIEEVLPKINNKLKDGLIDYDEAKDLEKQTLTCHPDVVEEVVKIQNEIRALANGPMRDPFFKTLTVEIDTDQPGPA